MEWHNPPQNWTHNGSTIHMTAPAKSDYWRVTRHDFIQDDAPFYYQTVTGDFTATVQVTAAYATLYDQAGLMIREGETVWMKCGVEYLDGVQQASAVITREFSDWSVMPLPDNPESVWMRVKRTREAVEVFFSRDGETYTLIRQGYLSTHDTLKVGVMCAAPQGNGFDVIFEGFSIEQA